ncbi:MAG: proprotein convertase P-domain-containing protein, partial [Sedimentisphaerales bacterium]|nr:proprotein convertase P-domain-containing protein [Sedimentisphaerales bacterium]
MDIRIAVQRIVTVVIIAVGGAATCFATPGNIYSYEFDLPIPAETDSSIGWMDEALLEVPDHIIICDIDVGISVTHTNVFDLQIFLQSPSGTRICLNMYDSFEGFFAGENYTNTIFDDEAQSSISQAEPPFTGRFR